MSGNAAAKKKYRESAHGRKKQLEGVLRWQAANPDKVLKSHRKTNGYPEPTRPMPSSCESCGQIPTGRKKRLDLDHDHDTGVFRGWLCGKCNRACGMLGDTQAAVLLLVAYLGRVLDRTKPVI